MTSSILSPNWFTTNYHLLLSNYCLDITYENSHIFTGMIHYSFYIKCCHVSMLLNFSLTNIFKSVSDIHCQSHNDNFPLADVIRYRSCIPNTLWLVTGGPEGPSHPSLTFTTFERSYSWTEELLEGWLLLYCEAPPCVGQSSCICSLLHFGPIR